MTTASSSGEASVSVGHSIAEQRVRILFEDASVLFYASNIPFGCFYAFIFCGLVPGVGVAPVEYGAIFLSAVIVQSIVGMIVTSAYKTSRWQLSTKTWIGLLAGIWFFSGVIWGGLTWLMWQPDNPVNQALLIVIVMGAEVIIFFCIAASFPVLCAGLVPLALISFLKFVMAGGTLALIVGTAAPLFSALLLFFGYKTAERYREVFELQHANAELASKFEEERDRAKAASHAKSEFLATMSHEIRTPMNGVLGFASLLSNSKLNETQRDYVQSIKDSGDTLLNIINDILDISKIEAGALTLDEETFSLRAVIESVLSLQRPKAQAKNLDLAMHVDPDLPEKFIGDSGRVRQMLMNFVGNAVKFTETGSIAVIAKPKQGISAEGEVQTISIEIVDTGIGIPEDKIAALFDRFTQVDSSRTRRFGGTGLGLAICRELASAMGGTVDVRSEVGAGSTFSVTLPLCISSSTDGRQAVETDVDLAGKSVLVVDDIALNRKIFELMLSSRDLRVTSVADAQSAVQEAEAASAAGTPFDVIIIDHMMPDTDGIDLAQSLKSSATTRDVPLVLSSSSDLVSEAEANAQGFVARAAKPIREVEIFQAIQIAVLAASSETNQLEEAVPNIKVGVAASGDRGEALAMPTSAARILLVEDNPVNQQLVLAALSITALTVDVAHDGVEAVAAVKAFPYDLILMDIQMPNMNGIDATKRIREMSGRNADLPIVAMTADAMAGDRERFLAQGMTDYIAKPIDLAEMLEKIDRYTDGIPAGAESAMDEEPPVSSSARASA